MFTELNSIPFYGVVRKRGDNQHFRCILNTDSHCITAQLVKLISVELIKVRPDDDE